MASITKQFAELSITRQRETLVALKGIYDAGLAKLTDPFAAPAAPEAPAPAKRGRKADSKNTKTAKTKAPKGEAKPRGRKPSGNALSDKIAKALANAPAEGLDVEAIAAGVKAAGFETKSDDKGLENQIRGQVSKLKKAGVVAPVEGQKGHYVLVPSAPATSDETPSE